MVENFIPGSSILRYDLLLKYGLRAKSPYREERRGAIEGR